MKEGWERKKIKDISVLIADGDWIESKHQSDEGIRLIQTGNIGNGVFKAKEDKPHYISEYTFDELGCTEIFSGDCLVSRLPEPVGRACLIPEIGCRMITAVDCSIIRFKEIILPKLFIYYTQSATYNRDVNNLTTGTTRKRISRKNLESILIPIPPLSEQERIVEELDCLSGVIEKKKQQLKELDALAQSIFYEMFGNPVENDRGWEVKKLGDVAIINPSKKETSKNLCDTDIVSFLPMEDLPIKACYYHPYQTRIYSEVQSSYTCFADNDVLMAKVTPCFENGKVGIASNLTNGVGYGSSEFIVIRTNNIEVIKEYIYFFIQDKLFIENASAQLTGTSGLRRVPRQYVENCKIKLPPLSLQQQFAKKIESIEKQKELIRKSIGKVEMLFNSRMDYYFG